MRARARAPPLIEWEVYKELRIDRIIHQIHNPHSDSLALALTLIPPLKVRTDRDIHKDIGTSTKHITLTLTLTLTLKVRTDRDIHKDIGLRETLNLLLEAYNPVCVCMWVHLCMYLCP